MTITLSPTIGRLAALAALSFIFAAPRMRADIIAYQANSRTSVAKLGSTTLDSCPASFPVCIEVTINFTADTANIVPFNVVGAAGFENFIGTSTVFLFNEETGDSVSATFDPNVIFLSVDQTNGGIGFGSALGGPTYPLGVYGGTPSISYATYDLRSNFTLSNGFAWFCPAGTCTLGTAGPGLATDQGLLSITPIGPVVGSSFFANVIQVTSVPEPSAILLVSTMLAALALSTSLKPALGILRRH